MDSSSPIVEPHEELYQRSITLVPATLPTDQRTVPTLQIKPIIRYVNNEGSNNQFGQNKNEEPNSECKKCRSVRFYPTPHYLVYERTSKELSGSLPDVWVAAPAHKLTVVRESRRRLNFFHPSNILIIIVFVAIITVILITKKKKKAENPLSILMAFI